VDTAGCAGYPDSSSSPPCPGIGCEIAPYACGLELIGSTGY
jgi:hypothetical protein